MPQVVFFLPSTWEAWIEIHVVGIWGINQRMASYNLSSPPFNIIMWTLLSKKKKKKSSPLWTVNLQRQAPDSPFWDSPTWNSGTYKEKLLFFTMESLRLPA